MAFFMFINCFVEQKVYFIAYCSDKMIIFA